jgi:hypothetical protein
MIRQLTRRRALVAGGTACVSLLAGCSSADKTAPSDSSARPQSTGEFNYRRKFSASDGDEDDLFGADVELSSDGTTALMTASHDNSNAKSAGSAYAFARTDDGWTQQQKLTATDGGRYDRFGLDAALSADGRTALVGSYNTNSNGKFAGATYVFGRSDGAWTQQQKLTAADGDEQDLFGSSVAVSADGRTALIGAISDKRPASNVAGSTYVFTRTDGEFTQQQKLTVDTGDESNVFGADVALSDEGRTALVSAPSQSSQDGSGPAYVVTQTDGGWSRRQELAFDDGDGTGALGNPVAMSGDGTVALVGAPADPNGRSVGSVYVFTDTDSGWLRRQRLSADNGDDRDEFGRSVVLSGGGRVAIVGAGNSEDPNGRGAGSTYVFARTNGEFTQRQKLTADDGDDDEFGSTAAVSADGSTALVGAPFDEGPNGEPAGSAYVFTDGAGER